MSAPSLPLDTPEATIPYALTPQRDITKCQLCGGRESQDRPFVAVLTHIDRSSRHLVHAGECHNQHSARIEAERQERAKARAIRKAA